MNNRTRLEAIKYLQNIALGVWGVVLVSFPLLFSSMTTDAFTLPKQIILAIAVILSTVLLGVQMIIEGKVRFRTTPFGIPLVLFTIAVFISSILAVNRYDALIAFLPLLFVVLSYFTIVNVAKNERATMILLACLVGGASIAAVLAILSFFKIWILPMQYTRTQLFTPFGSLLDQALYLALVLPVAGYVAYPLVAGNTVPRPQEDLLPQTHRINPRNNTRILGFAAAFILIALGLSFTVYMLVAVQKPLILPFVTGFQTAMAEISRDTGRVFQGFLFGNGFGTYLNVFTRFKEATYNANPTLWTFSFFRSSSFALELLATTGIVGLLAFLFLVYRIIREKNYFLPLILAIIAAFLLPFSFTMIALFFIMIALFAAMRAHQDPRRYGDLEFYFVALKQGLFAAQPAAETSQEPSRRYAAFLPILFFTVVAFLLGGLAYFTGKFIISDVTFQKSLVAASQNKAQQTYELQQAAFAQFPWRDAYFRIFSQTNLAIANSLASNQPAGSSPSAELQQNILGLIQQSINSGRQAVAVSPQTALNWNNLSSIYRALIGFGQNAEQFAVLTNQQAIALDPNNPQQYINLGGIYYQLGAWDDAQREFVTAVRLKQDYANAYYNLGHTLESKNDLQNALSAYQAVKQLVANDPESIKKIDVEIKALQTKIGEQAKAAPQTQAPAENQPPLEVNRPDNKLPDRNPKEPIPTVKVTVSPSPARTSGTPTPRAR